MLNHVICTQFDWETNGNPGNVVRISIGPENLSRAHQWPINNMCYFYIHVDVYGLIRYARQWHCGHCAFAYAVIKLSPLTFIA